MSADRDLIAELEQLLSRQPSDYQAAYEWLRHNRLTLAAALEAARRLPLELGEAEVLELARIAWDAENAADEVPAGVGYDWSDLGANGQNAEADGIRAVVAELGRRGHLSNPRQVREVQP